MSPVAHACSNSVAHSASLRSTCSRKTVSDTELGEQKRGSCRHQEGQGTSRCSDSLATCHVRTFVFSCRQARRDWPPYQGDVRRRERPGPLIWPCRCTDCITRACFENSAWWSHETTHNELFRIHARRRDCCSYQLQGAAKSLLFGARATLNLAFSAIQKVCHLRTHPIEITASSNTILFLETVWAHA